MSDHTTSGGTSPTHPHPPAAAGPARTKPTPSASAVQRALFPAEAPAAAAAAQAPPTNKNLRPSSLKATTDADPAAPRWPVSPRLKSPPASQQASRRNSTSSKNSDAEAKGRASGNSSSDEGSSAPAHALPSKIPRATMGINSTLETVEEGDLSSPREDSLAERLSQAATVAKLPDNSDSAKRDPLPAIQENGNVSGKPADAVPKHVPRVDGTSTSKPDPMRQTSAPAAMHTKPAAPSTAAPAKARTGEASGQKMQVETETVHSIPQASTNSGNERPGPSRSEAGGTLKAKPSSETIRPRKDKKKTAKKPPSIVSGPSTTKADIFEAKVASEIEGDDSDSDETFVYESEAPERRRRGGRNHSRTPSTTSVTSGNDRKNGIKNINSVLDSHRVRAKRSMKFASNCYAPTSSMDDESGDREPASSTPRRDGFHTHIGLWGKSSVNNEEIQGPQASKMRINPVAHARQPARVQSPRSATYFKTGDGYDYESGPGDNERTPLMGSIRANRTRGGPRRGLQALPRPLNYYEEPKRNWLSRIAGCMIIFIMVLLVLLGIAGFLFTSTKELDEVRVVQIQNVLASQQELMLDLQVEAINPNLASIAITSVDLQFFAKARPDENDWFWRQPRGSRSHRRAAARADRTEETMSATKWFPPGWEDPDDTYLFLGTAYKLNSALKFSGSPFSLKPTNSTGELRLSKPGTMVDKDGSEHWKQMIKDPFQLIFKGELKYQLPLNSKPVTAIIKAGVIVHPQETVDDAGSMRVDPIEVPPASP